VPSAWECHRFEENTVGHEEPHFSSAAAANCKSQHISLGPVTKLAPIAKACPGILILVVDGQPSSFDSRARLYFLAAGTPHAWRSFVSHLVEKPLNDPLQGHTETRRAKARPRQAARRARRERALVAIRMSTPVPPAKRLRKYEPHVLRGPTTTWNTTLKRQVHVRKRARSFKKEGYQCVTVKSAQVCPTRLMRNLNGASNVPEVFVGSRIPFELASPRPNYYELCTHRVEHPGRQQNPKTARVALYLPGGTVMELDKSASVAAPVLAVAGRTVRGCHLPRVRPGDFQTVQDIVASAGGTSVTLTAAALIKYKSNGTLARQPAGCPLCIVLPFHVGTKKWSCLCCHTMFDTAAELAKHDNAANIGRPRILTVSGKLGPPFIPPVFSGANSWKANALKQIEEGDVEKAMAMAPTMKRRGSTQSLRVALSKIEHRRRREPSA